MSTRNSKRRSNTESLIERLISRAEAKLEDDKTRVSISDYIRLVQFRLELQNEEIPQKVEVQWVEPDEGDERSETESAPKT